jgi:O-acetyl-ADP-ribose deacetylase (regulator of RNase III)
VASRDGGRAAAKSLRMGGGVAATLGEERGGELGEKGVAAKRREGGGSAHKGLKKGGA